jgi:hypothetical protein
MEPRPPRPRSSRPFETPGSPSAPSEIGERLYPASAEPAYYQQTGESLPPGSVAAQPLLPRQQRRQRRALRGVLATVVVVGLIAAFGWFFRDTIQGIISPPTPAPTEVAVTDLNAAAPGTPEAAPTSAALPNALATVTPTAAAATAIPEAPIEVAQEPELEANEGAVDAEPDRDISAQTLPLLDFLPTQDQVPPGLILADEAERAKADVVASLGGSEEASQLLDDWGWSGNAFREYIADEEVVAPGGTTYLNVSVHRFADAESASNALVFFSDQVVFVQGLQEQEPPAVGETARLLFGAPDGVPLAVLYAQDGPILYRIGGSTATAESDPSAEVLAVAAAIIPGQAE